ncbi:MAG: PH domain-containing protein [Planctomycetota bacterium]
MNDDTVLLEAKFNPKVCQYWLLSGTIALTFSCVGIPLLLLWIPLGLALTKKYLDNMSCTLTERTLKVSRGLFVRQEKTVPLDKITDLGLIQGPIMRYFDIQSLSIETAGGSGQSALVTLTAVENARDFRDAVLAQRDRVTVKSDVAATVSQNSTSDTTEILADIRDSLGRIESMMKKRAE